MEEESGGAETVPSSGLWLLLPFSERSPCARHSSVLHLLTHLILAATPAETTPAQLLAAFCR